MCVYRSISRFWDDDSGIEAVELGVISALIVGVMIVTLGLFAAAIQGRFTATGSTLDGIET